MQIKLFFWIILSCVFLIGNQNVKAQSVNAEIKVKVTGSSCDGKADVVIDIIKDDGSKLDISGVTFTISSGGNAVVTLPKGSNTTKLGVGSYTVHALNANTLYNGLKYFDFTVALGLIMQKAEYNRCQSGVSVSVAVTGGTGPNYEYELIDGSNNTAITTGLSESSEFTFSATTTSSSLKIKVTDKGCSKNTPITAVLTKRADLSAVSTVIEGDKSVCPNGTIELSVKNDYLGNNFRWKKGDTEILSTSNSLKIENVTEAKAGNYTFTMTFAGCDYSESFSIEIGGPPAPNVTSPASVCLNSGEVSLSKYADATSGNYTLVWYDSNASLIGTTAPKFDSNRQGATGKYFVSQKNSTGCESAKAELLVSVEDLPTMIGANNIIVCMSADSKPKMRIINARDYTYNLYTSYSSTEKTGSGKAVNDTAIIETTQDLTTGSNYFIETVNANGCVASGRTTKNISLQESWISGSNKICFGGNLSLSTDYTGGKVKWTKPDNSVSESRTLTVSNMGFENSGIYSLVIEEPGLSCVMTDKIEVKVTQPAPPVVTTNSFRYHQGETATAMTATPKAGLTLKWYNNDNVLIPGQSPVPATDETGVFTYRVSQDSAGCESPKVQVTVIVGTIPDAVAASDINICIADKPVIQIKNTIQDYKYTVYHKSTVIAEGTGNGNSISLSSKVSIAENAELEVTVSDIYGVESAKTKKGMIAPAGLIVENSSVFCIGSTFRLVAVEIPEAIYKWTSPNGDEELAQSISVTDAKKENSGIYTLAVTTAGCPVIEVGKTVSVTQPAPPTVEKDSYRFYENEVVSALQATPKEGLTLKWYYPENVPISSPVIPATGETGTSVYYVSQDSLGCESAKVPITVTVGEVPSSVPAADINVCIADKPVIHIKNTVQNYKYTVYYKNSVIAEKMGTGDEISMISTVSISENADLEIAVSDTYSVSSARTVTGLISINNLVDLQKSSLSVCDGSNGKLVAVEISEAVYAWTTPNGSTSDKQFITITGAGSADSGIYILSVTTLGCPAARQNVEVKVAKPAKPSTTKEIFYCTGDNAAQLSATPLSGYKLVWFDESQTQLANAPTPNTSAAGSSVYYVSQVSVSDANCSSDSEKITVVVEDKPAQVVLEPVNVCATSGTTVSASVRIPVSTKGYVYSLYSQETGGSLAGQATSAGDSLPVDITINDGEINSGKIYYLEVTNKAGCTSERTPVEIVLITITVSPDELPPYKVEEFYSQKIKTNASSPAYSVIKGYLPVGFEISSTGDVSGTASAYAEPSVFTVEITNDLGCAIQKEYTLKSELLVSKMFSPNGDGLNDVFMKGYKVSMFDRLGRKLYNGDNGWDGTYNGRTVAEDVYFYVLYYKDSSGAEQRITGYVTLIKTM
jgi:gliding motility-associated-like protein